jgi:hypothetical protein
MTGRARDGLLRGIAGFLAASLERAGPQDHWKAV